MGRKLILLMAVLLGWQCLISIAQIPDYLLPAPLQVATSLWEDWGLILSQLSYTAGEWVLGLVISVTVAGVVAIASFRFQRVHDYLSPILVVTQTIPFLAVAPLLMIWLGLGITPKVILVVLSCAFPVALALEEGLNAGKQQFHIVVAMLDLSWPRALLHVYLPAALPQLFTGFKISASYAFVTTVMAELIGSENGLGVYLIRAQTSYRTDRVMAAILVIISISLLNTAVVDAMRKRVVFWDQTKK